MEAAVLKYTNKASLSFANVYNGKLMKKPNVSAFLSIYVY